jgi:outer membrane lipoprotein carrier protein
VRSTSAPRRIERAGARLWLCALLGALCVGAAEAPADAPSDAASALAALQARYDGVRDLRARFVQHSFTAALGRSETVQGVVVVQRPGRMRWSYDAPDGRVIVLDGQDLRVYSPQDRQLQIAALGSDTVSPTALSFLMGQGRLADQFRAERLAAQRPELGLRLLPLGDSSFESLVLWLDAGSYELRESELVDLFGNRTRLELRDAVFNGGVRAEDFELAAPPGTEVIDLR